MWSKLVQIFTLQILAIILLVSINTSSAKKDDVDVVIEDEITQRLAEDLIESIEKKFQTDLERSVDMVLTKIKMLLQNGTSHVQDKLVELQNEVLSAKQDDGKKLERCMMDRANETSSLAEKALHQMVLCGYALIGHDPAQALAKIMQLKESIQKGLKPLHEHKSEVFILLKACGHEHENLKKVVKCVISKSPRIKSSMMEVTAKLIEGVVDLTKLMAHGAMHEACLIEVVRSIEEEAAKLIGEFKSCASGEQIDIIEVEKYIKEGNATVLDVTKAGVDRVIDESDTESYNKTESEEKKDAKKVEKLLRRLLKSKGAGFDESFRRKLSMLKDDLEAGKLIHESGNNIGNGVVSQSFDNKV